MADKKITQLTSLVPAASADIIPIVDVTASETKKITASDLFASPQPIGSANPDTGEFTTLQLPTGATINEFSTDITLAGNSNTAVPTERATKTYVDSKVAGKYHNQLLGLQGGDSTSEYYHLTEYLYDNLYSSGLGVGFGYSTSDSIFINHTTPSIIAQVNLTTILQLRDTEQILGEANVSTLTLDSTSAAIDISGNIQATFNSSGVAFASGTTVNEISNDVTLASASATSLSTEYAIKTYVDTQISGFVTHHNQLLGLQGGDSTSEYYHLTEYLYDNLYSSGTGVGFGDSTSTSIFIDQETASTVAGADQVAVLQLSDTEQILGEENVSTLTLDSTSATIAIGGSTQAIFSAAGVALSSGVAANEISNDTALTDASQTSVVTEYVVKTYIDSQIQSVRHDLDLLNVRYVSTDTTAITGDVCLVDTTAGPVNIQMVESSDGHIIIKKVSQDYNQIYVTTIPGSSIDGQATNIIDIPYQSTTYFSNGTAFFIV